MLRSQRVRMNVGKSASWSKWWCVKMTVSMSVVAMPLRTSFQVVAGPQSKSSFSPPMSTTYAEPKLSGVGLGVPHPMIVTLGVVGSFAPTGCSYTSHAIGYGGAYRTRTVREAEILRGSSG